MRGNDHRIPIKDIRTTTIRYVTIGKDGTIGLWHVGSLELLRAIPTGLGVISAVHYSQAHKRIAIATAQAKLALYDATSMRPQLGATSVG